jgi:hypothetical protein
MMHERQESDDRPVSYLTVGGDALRECYNQELGERHSQVCSHDDL